jgi:hypothetical protein
LELSRKYRLLPLSEINSPFLPRSSTCRCIQGMCLVEPCRDYDLPSLVSRIRLARVLWTVIVTPTSASLGLAAPAPESVVAGGEVSVEESRTRHSPKAPQFI